MKTLLKIIFLFIVFCAIVCCKHVNASKDQVIDGNLGISFKTDNPLPYFNGCVDGVSAIFTMDNGAPKTWIDSVFFYSHLDVAKYKLIKHVKFLGRYLYTGKLAIDLNGTKYHTDTFWVYNGMQDGNTFSNALIGYDILKNYHLRINFIDNYFSMIDSFSIIGYDSIKMLPTSYLSGAPGVVSTGLRVIKTDVFSQNPQNHKIGNFFFDLGCGGNRHIIFTQHFFKSLQKDMLYIGEKTAKGASIMQSKSILWKVDSVKISNNCYSNLDAATLSFGYSPKDKNNDDPLSEIKGDGFIGWRFFIGYDIIIDFKNNLLLVKKINQNE